ncbi:TraB/GumN family protein [Aliidiomarina soli]|uniref:TraB/GumN family protein n=1 Tax=Aliidiomarina soli TaxID=1928574 RepID=A0A432WFL6_9GAMM|nr:TraB/GumN family protein [Aliidiomarina soli]RUO32580.1 TraB/GumN family protein [Aliidiomarina soli]
MKMMFRTFTLALLVSVFTISTAQASLLWKVTGNDLDQPSYLFGTIHVICQDRFYMDERIEDAIASSEQLAKEIDISAPGTMMRLQQLMVNPDGPYLEEHLNEDELATLDQYFLDNFGVGLAQVGALKPMALNSMLLMGAMPCADTESYEAFFAQRASELELPILELESVEFQMSLFDNIPQEEQVSWLLEMVKDDQATTEQMESLIDAYLSEDLDTLLALMEEDPQFAEYAEVLLDERNQNWVAPIREMIHERSTFIAVGAGHLPGDMGVITLLQDAGYTVEPVAR